MDKASRQERREVVSWVKESSENLETFAAMKAKITFSSSPDTIKEKVRILPIITAVAAIMSIPLLAGAIYLYIGRNDAVDMYNEASMRAERLQSQNNGSITYVANRGTKSTVVLPDSSIVRLNSDSRLIVPQRFDSDVRTLTLYGEGYFEVRHHEDWPMHIHTSKGVTVKVLGTTFDLSAYDDDAAVKVTLIEGKVVVREDRTFSEHLVRPNQEISINDCSEESMIQNAEIKKADIEKNTGWKDGNLIFDNTAMSEVTKQLERWYGVNIHVSDDDILKNRLTATFTTESITRVMELICFSSMVDYEINGTEIYIRPSRGYRR